MAHFIASESCARFFNVQKEDLAFVMQYLGGQKSQPFTDFKET